MPRKIKYWIISFYPFWLGFLFGIIGLSLDGKNLNASFYMMYIPGLLILTSPLWGVAVYLMFNYMKYDNEVNSIVIDKGELFVQTKNGKHKVKFVEKVERDENMDLGFDFLPWSRFYYYRLLCENEILLHVSCMNNICSQLSTSKVLHKKYPTIPYNPIDSTVESNDSFNSRFSMFIKKYQNRSKEELIEITNSKKYSESAKKAAKTLIDKM